MAARRTCLRLSGTGDPGSLVLVLHIRFMVDHLEVTGSIVILLDLPALWVLQRYLHAVAPRRVEPTLISHVARSHAANCHAAN